MKRSREYARRSNAKRSRTATRKSRIRTLIGTLAESKRENMHVSNQTLNHDAGDGAIVGGFARPNNKHGWNWLAIAPQGGTSSKFNRDGDAVYSQYIDYKLQLTGYSDYPSQSCRIIIFSPKALRTQTLTNTSTVASLFVTDGSTSGSGNLMIQPVDTINYNVLRDFVVYPLKNQNQSATTTNANGLLYDVLHPSIPSGPFTSNAGYYRELFTQFSNLVAAVGTMVGESPLVEWLYAYYQNQLLNETAKYTEAVDRYDELAPDLFQQPDDAGNDANYPIVSGRIKTNRKIQYLPSSEAPIKSTDFIQIAIIPYADPTAGTQATIMRYNQEVTHYFKDF